jgi:ribosome-associated translation inhibitor RaiA
MVVRITYKHLEFDYAVDAYVRKRAAELSRLGPPVLSCRVELDARGVLACRVVASASACETLRGRRYGVRIEAPTAAGDVVVGDPDTSFYKDDLYAAIDEAFDRAVRAHARMRPSSATASL